MEEEEKKEAIEKTGVDYDKLKEIISTVYPVRYERRTAIAPLLWICGAMFTTSLVWCTVNVCLNVDDKNDSYIKFVLWVTGIVAGVSFLTAIASVVASLIKEPTKGNTDDILNSRLRSEHFLLEMRRMDLLKEGGNNAGEEHGDTTDIKSEGDDTETDK